MKGYKYMPKCPKCKEDIQNLLFEREFFEKGTYSLERRYEAEGNLYDEGRQSDCLRHAAVTA